MTPNGPFIVTQRRKPCNPELCTERPCPLGCDDDVALRALLYREAFATLEEARKAPGDAGVGARMLASHGGTVTLPNGDVIEVAPTTWRALAMALPSNQRTLRAWNAEHGIGIGGRA